jgi:hypothetical protein
MEVSKLDFLFQKLQETATTVTKGFLKTEKPDIFGVSLAEVVRISNNHLNVNENTPRMVKEMIEFLDTQIDEVGLYRLSGLFSRVKSLKEEYKEMFSVKLENENPNTIASLLKEFIRELPEIILTQELKDSFEELFIIKDSTGDQFDFYCTDDLMATGNAKFLNDQHIKSQFINLIQKLPIENRCLLGLLMNHLRRVALNWQVNKMGFLNLQVVWSPTLRIKGPCLFYLIYHSKLIKFDEPESFMKSIAVTKPSNCIASTSDNLQLNLPIIAEIPLLSDFNDYELGKPPPKPPRIKKEC